MAPRVVPAARLRQRLREGAPLAGTFLKMPALETVDIAASAGFDMVVVDGEHAQLDEGEIRMLIRHAAALDLPALVRIPALDAGLIGRLLEAGAAGIQLSSLRSCSQRDALIAATRYAPAGTRSVSLAHPQADYGAVPLAAYLERQAAAPPLVVGQIETAKTDDPLASLLPGLDVAFIGTTDLSVDLGRPGLLDDERVRARVAEIAAAASAAGVALGAWTASVPALAALAQPVRYALIGSDMQLLRAGATALVAAARGATT
jgi:4-hydroxy-2-oxoheptanedioate aldolase